MGMPIARHRFTVDEYHRMGAAGVFHEDDRVELLDGEIVEMSPIGAPHVACVIRLTALLSRLAGTAALVSVQNPVTLERRSEPQPDVVLLPRRADLSGAWLPDHADTLVVIEVADTSVEYDRNKLRLYADAGIPEVWLVNLPEDHIEVYRSPRPGSYGTTRVARRGETLTPLQAPAVTLRVEDILG
jgi:Uma2 family endonuclease